MFLIFIAVGTSLLAIRKIGEEAITAACDDTNADGTTETNNVKEFFESIYDKMDTYYCQDYLCPCEIKPDTFKDATPKQTAYYATLNGTGTDVVNF